MRRELSPIDKDFLSDAGIFDIGRCFNGTNWYMYSVREWKNGAKGAIVDLYELSDDVDSEGNSLLVKEEGRNLGHHDSLYFVSSEIDLVQESEGFPGLSDLWRRCPLVAEGIIARFVKVNITDRDYPAMFEAYYEMEKTNYAIERKMRDPYTFNVNLEEEFANGAHLRQEQQKIEFSLQHLLPYIRKSQHAQIKRTADAYIAFVKSKATSDGKIAEEKKWNINEEELRKHFKPIFTRKSHDRDDSIPILIGIIQNTKTDKGIGQIALQIFYSDYFQKDNFNTFKSWYREFCRIVGSTPNKSYKKNDYIIKDEKQLSSFAFLKKVK